MSGDDRAAPGSRPPRDGGVETQPAGLHRLMKAVFDRTPWGRRLNRHAAAVNDLRVRLDRSERRLDRSERRLDRSERRLDAAEDGVRQTQSELEEVREGRLAVTEVRLDAVEPRQDAAETALGAVSDESNRLRDVVVPAAVGRADALLERLATELDEVASLVERMLRREPLPTPDRAHPDEAVLSSALAAVQPAMLEAFRGSEAEIRHRLDHYLEALRGQPPVLDLGCGRGELLLMLREAGVDAAGIEGDAAVAASARRRGLAVIEGDVLDSLRGLPDQSRGAVTAIHLFEHLSSARQLAVLAEVRRVLRPGGLFIAEFPNPHSLRVGAALYWIDPTHRRPLMPETFELYLASSGFAVERRQPLHPFPDDQLFAVGAEHDDSGLAELGAIGVRLDRVCRRLDDLVNGERDVAVWARRPGNE